MVHTYSKTYITISEWGMGQWKSINHHTFPIKDFRKGRHSIKSSSLKDNRPLQECSSARNHSELLIRWQLILEWTSLVLSSRRAHGNTSAKRPATAIWLTLNTIDAVASQVGFHLKRTPGMFFQSYLAAVISFAWFIWEGRRWAMESFSWSQKFLPDMVTMDLVNGNPCG